MKIVVDSNIIFSSLLKNGEAFRDIFFSDSYKLYSCNFAIIEIFKYKEKILKYSKIDEPELLDRLYKVLKNVTFINEKFISDVCIEKAYDLCSDIDEKDTLFIALTIELDSVFWTGDKKLINGLKKKGFDRFFQMTS